MDNVLEFVDWEGGAPKIPTYIVWTLKADSFISIRGLNFLALHQFLGNNDWAQLKQTGNLLRHIPQVKFCKDTRLILDCRFVNVIQRKPRKKIAPNFMSLNFF